MTETRPFAYGGRVDLPNGLMMTPRFSNASKFVALASILVGISVLAAPSVISGYQSRFDCAPSGFERRTAFDFRWEQRGNTGNWLLETGTARDTPSYLLLEDLKPSFKGLSPPVILSSAQASQFRSVRFPAPPPLSVRSATSYTVLPAGLDIAERHQLLYPVINSPSRISQAPGSERHWRARLGITRITHQGWNANAVDIEAPIGAVVVAGRSGTVAYAEHRVPDQACVDPRESDRLGNVVVILHDDGTEATYSHLRQNSVKVRVGQVVSAGAPIGEVGISGWTGGPHLHVQVGGLTIKGYKTVPLSFRCADGSTIEPVEDGPACSAPRPLPYAP